MNRRGFLLLTAAAAPTLAGCGFEPVYGTQGAASGLLDRIAMDEPNDNNSYLLVRELEDRLGRTSGGETFGLSYSVATESKAVGKTVAQVTSRFDILGEVTYALRDLDTKEVLTTNTINSFVGYSASGSTVSEVAAEADAYERLMVILADRIVAELQAYATTNAL
ncbi:LPS assembly lipoprotein LptE [Shimia sp. Alg240-R146]|uniref:LPS assembly lipoprotein LptE n=1 Tax=Shimia sp. Alg240-R146 TaxID=2993449 RepID=UPI0022E207ED|nr:LPS assembly lipoprotein LptE [Shimia sp. Alg240-R146]